MPFANDLIDCLRDSNVSSGQVWAHLLFVSIQISVVSKTCLEDEVNSHFSIFNFNPALKIARQTVIEEYIELQMMC